jgi:glutathione synthase/RimK-type ligase-like ATP-grasp enzyme
VLALVTAAAARDLDTDLPLLLEHLPDAVVEVWDDASVDWSRFDAAIVRSTWDYADRRDEFLAWTVRTATYTELWNPPATMAWSTDKRYLAELAGDGIPVVPSAFAEPGDEVADDVLAGDVVVKPTVGAGSRGVVRTRGDAELGRRHVRDLHDLGRTALVQPYLADVDAVGETGLVYVGGEFSHAFRKSAILAAPIHWEAGLYAEERIEPHAASRAERELGDRVLASLPSSLAYARVDLLPTSDGPVVLELELVEPSLFLQTDPSAAKRAAAAFRSLVT